MKYKKHYNRIIGKFGSLHNMGKFDLSKINTLGLITFHRFDGFLKVITKFNDINSVDTNEYDFVICNDANGKRLVFFFRYKEVKEYKCQTFDFERAKQQLSTTLTGSITFSEKSIHDANFIYAARYNGSVINVDRFGNSEYDFKYGVYFKKVENKNIVDKIIIFK